MGKKTESPGDKRKQIRFASHWQKCSYSVVIPCGRLDRVCQGESPRTDLTESPAEIRTTGEPPKSHQQPLNVVLKEKMEN